MDGGWGDRQKSRTHTNAKLFSCYKPWLTPDLLGTMGPRWPLRASCTALEALAKAIGISGSEEKSFSWSRTKSSAQAVCKLYT